MTSYSLDSNAYPIITPTSGSWSAWAEYRQRSSDSTHVYYDLWNTVSGGFQSTTQENLNNSGGYQIRVESSTDIWSDYPGGGHTPTFQGNVNGVITLGSGSGDFVFTKPSGTGQTPWSSGGSSGSSGPNTLSGGSSPEIKDIHMYKLSDTSVSYSFNWQNLNSAFVWVNNVMHTISLGGAGNSGHHSSTLTGLNDLDVITISNTNFEYIHRFVEWSKLVWGNSKSVIAETFGAPGYEYRMSNSLGHNSSYTAYQNGNQFAITTSIPTSGKVTWQVWKYVASPLHISKHGSSFTTGTNTRHRNFW